MHGCLSLLVLLIIPSALQTQTELKLLKQTETVEQKLTVIFEWLGEWRTYSGDNQVLITNNQVHITDNQDDLNSTLNKIVAEAVGVKTQLAELVKVAQATQNVTSQLLTDLQVLKGRQAVGGAVQGAQVFMFLAYLATITVFYLVRHCRKHREKVAREEFELLETKLQASRSKRQAAAARASKQSPQ